MSKQVFKATLGAVLIKLIDAAVSADSAEKDVTLAKVAEVINTLQSALDSFAKTEG